MGWCEHSIGMALNASAVVSTVSERMAAIANETGGRDATDDNRGISAGYRAVYSTAYRAAACAV